MSTDSPDLVDIDFDIDRYIADGGNLYDIRFVSLAQALEWARTVPAEIVSSRLERWGRYCTALSKKCINQSAVVGEHLSEDDLRLLWKDSAA